LLHICRRERKPFSLEFQHCNWGLVPTNKNIGTAFGLQISDAINLDGRMSEGEGELRLVTDRVRRRPRKCFADHRMNFSFEVGLGRRLRKLRCSHRNRSI
jgi:hypothetical protein